VSPASEERIALDVHAHLAPVLKDRLAGIDGVSWNDADGAMTIDGYTLAAKSVYRPEALIAWMDEHRIERAWISVPPPLYRLGLDAERGQLTGRPGADTGAEKPRLAFKRFCIDCIAHDAGALQAAATMHGPEHVLFGSDWPFSMGLPDPHKQLADTDAGLRRLIFQDNPRRFLSSW